MARRTVLYDEHLTAGAKLVDFAGWDMPLHYGSQLDEHRQVRESCGMFDVSHMLPIDIAGPAASGYLRHLLANDVARLQTVGAALYSCMLTDSGGVIDDLIVYRLTDGYRVVVNAGTADKDLAWMQRQADGYPVELTPRRDLAMLAVQGPQARDRVLALLDDLQRSEVGALKPFHAAEFGEVLIARTGYTGEDGFEIMLSATQAPTFWRRLRQAGVIPCGLGARDTLRLEAGLNLYGQDMDEAVSPLESNLGWTVAWEPAERTFIGRAALETQRAQGPGRKLVGLVLAARGVLRAHQRVFIDGQDVGELTSGSFSPTLGLAIGLARMAADAGGHCEVDIRGKRLPAQIVKPPFVRHGQAKIQLPQIS
jgi:aminomethyltransferase